ncbi:Tyrosine recombinase XerC [Eubacterium callanderi]|nr:Tyrosine recombinase XerC [Eubacterium callanderi]WPK74186.1 Tyrosine recombinase XerC [Eubacterium callanderi]
MTMSDVLEARRNAILSAIEILRSKKIVSMDSIDNQRREKGSGGLRYREERKIWEASIDLGIDSNGKRIRKVRTGKTKEIAFKNLETAVMDHYSKLEETLHKELLEIESQIEKEKINKNGILLSEFYKEFVSQKKRGYVTDRTLGTYVDNYKTIQKYLKNVTLQETVDNIEIFEKFAKDLLLGKKPIVKTTFLRKLNFIEQTLDYAVKKKLIESNILKKEKLELPLCKKKSRVVRDVSVEDYQKLIECSRKENFFVYVMVTALLATGLRIGELAGLKIQDIDKENKKIAITKTLTYNIEIDEDFNITKRGIITVPPKTVSGNRFVYVPDEIIDNFIKLHESYREDKKLMKKSRPIKQICLVGLLFCTPNEELY